MSGEESGARYECDRRVESDESTREWPVLKQRSARTVILALAAASLLVGGVARGTEVERLRFTDAAGDANALNSQGEYGVELGVPTAPAQIAEADLLQVDLIRSGRGYELVFRTFAPPSAGFTYGITAELSSCRIFVRQERSSEGVRTIVYGCGYDGEVVGNKDRVRGRTLTVRLPRGLGDHFLSGTRMRAETLRLFGPSAPAASTRFSSTLRQWCRERRRPMPYLALRGRASRSGSRLGSPEPSLLLKELPSGPENLTGKAAVDRRYQTSPVRSSQERSADVSTWALGPNRSTMT